MRRIWPAHHGATIVVGLIVLFLAVTLLLIGANSPYTHANLGQGYDAAYARTDQIIVGAPLAGRIMPRSAHDGADAAAGEQLFSTTGCAGCHGFSGEGGALGKRVAGASPDLITTKVRSGATRMPPFSTDALSDADLAQIVAYLGQVGSPQSAPSPTPPAKASPSAPPASPAATPAQPTASAPRGSDPVLALGKRVYETAGGGGCQECHGADAKGRATKDGTNAPNIRGATEQKFRDALNGGAALMVFLKKELTEEQIDAVVKYLDYLTNQ